MSTTTSKIPKFIAKYFVIQPFLFVVSIIDYVIGLIIPYKYEDAELPDKDAVLMELTDKSDPKSAYRSVLYPELISLNDASLNLYDEFIKSVQKYGELKTLGIREIHSIDDEKQANGKIFKKYSLGNYKWMTYEEVSVKAKNFSNGLLQIGLKSNQNIVLFAETRPEWLMSALACFRIKVPIVTLYSTLGIDALAFGINQTDASYVITSTEQLPKIQKILAKIPNLTTLIVLTDKFSEKNFVEFKKNVGNRLRVYSMEEVEEMGVDEKEVKEFTKPKKDDLAIIMYTSGSTGNPKGVMISHGNLLTTFKALITRLGTIKIDKDIYIAYLPLAHVLELCCEIGCLLNGIRLGYSTPQTIADTSTAIKKGQKGDLRVLKPTIMPSVPVVLERLSKTVYEKLSATSWFKQTLFKLAYRKKLEYFRAERSTRLLDLVLFKRIRKAVLGGKVRLVVSGGAILNKEVHEFVQVCLSPVLQAYGLTETCGGGTTQLPNQSTTDVVGSVVPCCEIRLVDWPEAGYRCTDKPNPRGEIYIGGENITMGYYNLPDKTNEDYKYINGVRYFATGDVGEVLPTGNIKIIDRKKDLVKLQGGEYVSLNKVESVIKLLPFADNCCVVADSTKINCVCLICPNQKKIQEYLDAANKSNGDAAASANNNSSNSNSASSGNNKPKSDTISDLIKRVEQTPGMLQQIVKEMSDHCLVQGLDRFEIPTRIKFVKEIWTPDTGLVTDSLKLKRKEIEKFYKSEVEILYK